MNADRYAAYQAALGMLEESRPFGLPADEREVLRDCAEGLLLSRETDLDGAETSELTGRAALALARSVMEDRWSNEAADKAWLLIRACGPGAAAGSASEVAGLRTSDELLRGFGERRARTS